MVEKKRLDDRYTVTSTGEAYDNVRKRYLKKYNHSLGYKQVFIHGKYKYLHRLVAELFIPNPEGKKEVDHIDYDRSNNEATNLRWVTRAENIRHSMPNRVYTTPPERTKKMNEINKQRREQKSFI